MPRLSEAARYVIKPEGIVTTAWPRVRDTCANIGWTFDEWQDGAGTLILGCRSDGLYAADTVVMSIPRQVGKTFLVGAIVFALMMIIPGLTVIWTAHRFKTARETFTSMKSMAKQPRVADRIEKITEANGEEGILFRNGSRVLFGARENGFGLGFTKVGVLILDEGQRLTTKAMDDLVPTMNTVLNPLVIMMGTPPRPTDPGEVFAMLRQGAIDEESEDTLYIEFSADQGADLDDRDQLRKANPSYPTRTNERAIRRMRKMLTDDSFRREAFGIWDDFAARKPLVTGTRWDELTDAGPEPDVRPDGLGVDMSHQDEISIHACWIEDTSAHVEEVWAGIDPDEAIDWLETAAGRRTWVIIDAASPAGSLISELRARGVRVWVTNAPEMAQGCGAIKNRINTGTLTHAGQKRLTAALRNARPRPIRDAGGWGWDRRDPTQPIHPIVSATLALLGATTKTRRRTARNAPTKRKAVIG